MDSDSKNHAPKMIEMDNNKKNVVKMDEKMILKIKCSFYMDMYDFQIFTVESFVSDITFCYFCVLLSTDIKKM